MGRKPKFRARFVPAAMAIAALLFPACDLGGKDEQPAAPRQMGGSMQGVPLSLTGTTSTFAGVSLTGSQDGMGTAARFNYPSGITTDGTSLFVTDSRNHTIRKVVIATGEVTTLAGKAGEAGSADGTGAAARFDYPNGITTDGTNLFVTDSRNHTIRKVVIATGEVTTLAGEAGSADGTDAASQLHCNGITTDGTNLYVTGGPYGSWVQKVVIATGEVTTLANAGGILVGITTDGTNVYVTDNYRQTVRRVVIATGEVTTLAGTDHLGGSTDGTGTAARFYYPGGITTDGTSLYVTDARKIRKISIATGEVTTLAGHLAWPPIAPDGTGTAAGFSEPSGITTDGTNLFVADAPWPVPLSNQGGNSIRKVVIATGEVTTFAGAAGSIGCADGTGTAARFHDPFGITTDGTHLYLADYGNYTIRKAVIATGEVTTLAGTAGEYGSADGTGAAAQFSSPLAITTDGTNLFVMDFYANTIRKVVIATGAVTTLAGTAGQSGSADGTGAAARFNYPYGMTTDGTNLYLADTGNHTIRKVAIATGEVTTLAGAAGESGSADGTGAAARFNEPIDVTTDGTSLYVTDWGGGTIRKVTIATGEVTTLAGTAGEYGSADGTGAAARFNRPRGITTDGTSLYVTEAVTNTIRKVAIATGEVTTLAGTAGVIGSTDDTGAAASFNYPVGITTDGISLYAVDTLNNTIRRID